MDEKKGRYCEKHDEYAADGACRWCEPPMTATELALPRKPTLLEVAKEAEAKLLGDLREYALPELVPTKIDTPYGPQLAQRPQKPPRFVKCACREATFDTGVPTPHGLPLEGVMRDVLHTPTRCTRRNGDFVQAAPASWLSCSCGEMMFEPRLFSPGAPIQGITLYGHHTPERCQRRPTDEELRRRYPKANKP